jgi:sulfur carrier protein ThiS
MNMTLDITVRSYTSLPNPPPGFRLGRPFELTLEEGTTLAQLVDDVLGIPPGEVALMAVNGERANEDYALELQDHVDLFPPIGGG